MGSDAGDDSQVRFDRISLMLMRNTLRKCTFISQGSEGESIRQEKKRTSAQLGLKIDCVCLVSHADVHQTLFLFFFMTIISQLS